MLNKIQIGRRSTSGHRSSAWPWRSPPSQLPFAIWNIKGYLDTIPRELEEAAAVDGAGALPDVPKVILPLATPVLAVTAFFGFIAGWTEFYFSSVFLTEPTRTTRSRWR